MKTTRITAILLCMMALPMVRADNVTVHGTVGMLEAQLITKEGEQVGTVQVWNTAMDMNVVVTPFSDRLTFRTSRASRAAWTSSRAR